MLPTITVLPPPPDTPSTIFSPSRVPSPNPDLCACKPSRTCSCTHAPSCPYSQVPPAESIASFHSHGTAVSAQPDAEPAPIIGMNGPSPSGTFPAFGEVAPFQAGGVAEETCEKVTGAEDGDRKTGWVLRFKCLCEVDCGCGCSKLAEEKKAGGQEESEKEREEEKIAKEDEERKDREGDLETKSGCQGDEE